MKKLLFFSLFFVLACGLHDPVPETYFTDINKIEGGNKPAPPGMISITACDNIIKINFSASPDAATRTLSYVLYYSATDPALFIDEKEFYDPLRARAITDTVDTIPLVAYQAGTYYFWLTAFAGGRESDHSAVLSITTPGTTCP